MTQFSDLGLAPNLLATLRAKGYSEPTPIQAKAIPAVLAGRDLLGVAQTGTGKTAAFALPMLHNLRKAPKGYVQRSCRTLVLAPTRELAQQIAESFRAYGSGQGVRVAVFVGGTSLSAQVRALAGGVDVLVATPGRLIDQMNRRAVRLDLIEVLVLDEADQMLDLGFLEPIRKIVAATPKTRQNLFFSATMAGPIAALAGDILVNPAEARAAPEATTVERVTQRVIHVEAAKKKDVLLELMRPREVSRALIFTRTKRGADRLAKFVSESGVEVAAIHGDKSQSQRERALAAFKTGKVRALIATDIAARGIDVEGISHVFNFELPNVPEAYVHRIGRTARAGAAGAAITLCDRSELGLLRDIEKLTRRTIPAEGDRPVAPTAHRAEHPAKPGRKRPRGPWPKGRSGKPNSGRNGGRNDWSPTAVRSRDQRLAT